MKMSLNIDQKTSEGQRNILGIPKTPEWIEDFNIGVVMVLTPVKMNFKPNLDTFYILSTNKIL